ncbi:MAG TPA: penicillin-binding protein 2 [Pseudoclavibacter sp.]|nr:penicillin-binding protein 2 [Pseudoclavibacter sp.]
MPARLGRVSTRVIGFLGVIVLVLAIFTVKLVDIQVVRSDALQSEAAEQLQATSVITATRGRILDSNGNVLAETVLRYKVVVDQRNVADYVNSATNATISVEQVATEVAEITGQDESVVLASLRGTSSYSVVAEELDISTYQQIRDLDVPWFLYETEEYRTYPSGAVAGNLLGFLGSDSTALAGIEYAQDQCLTGTDGEETYLRSGSSSDLRIPGTTEVTQEAVDGGDITLTIDMDVQWYAQQVAAEAAEEVDADWASIVVMDAKTGDLIAVADAPSVDPSDYLASDADDRGARSFQASFEPGSTFKSLTLASAIEEGVTTPTSEYTVADSRTTSIGTTISDSFTHGVMQLTTTGILRYSSNVGITELGEAMSEETRYNYLQAFGIGETTSVDFPGESSGTLTDYNDWDVHSALTEMFGQGPVAATPVQITSAYQAIANGGERISPRLVESCTSSDGTVTENATSDPVQVVSEDTADQVIDVLENVVNQGGAPMAAVDGYRVAGKTGTAQIAENGVYLADDYALSFVGMAPAEDPQYVVGVFTYKASSDLTWDFGASFSSVMSYVLKKYDVSPSTESAEDLPITWE